MTRLSAFARLLTPRSARAARPSLQEKAAKTDDQKHRFNHLRPAQKPRRMDSVPNPDTDAHAAPASAEFILRADRVRRGETGNAPELTGQAAEIIAADKIRRGVK